jgi:hypothetical protein
MDLHVESDHNIERRSRAVELTSFLPPFLDSLPMGGLLQDTITGGTQNSKLETHQLNARDARTSTVRALDRICVTLEAISV